MKKLMFAAIAGLAMTGYSIESGNIVGYATTDLVAGAKATGASFVDVGANGIKLTQIVPQGFEKSAGEVSIQMLDANGGMTTQYRYYKGQTRGSYKTDGWYEGTTLITSGNDVTFEAGQGLWMTGAAGYSFQTAGEVLMKDVGRNLAAGSQMLANPFPTALNLTAVVPGGFEKSAGEISIQMLDANGGMTTQYRYYKGQTRGSYKTDGWYEGTTLITSENDVAFAAGQGLWVSGVAGYTLTFTCPIAK